MKIIIPLLGFLLLLLAPSAQAAEDYENGLLTVSLSILNELKSLNELEGKRISVLGFKDMSSGEGCRPLSVAIANEIDTDINKLRAQLEADFKTVPRHDLDAIETEYLISKGGMEGDIIDRMSASDILITGMWQDEGDELHLLLKAVHLKQENIDELTAASVRIDKNTIPGNLLSCLGGVQVTVENFESGTIDWKRKIIRVKGWGAANKAFPSYVWKKSAEEAAIVDAQVKLLELINGLELNSKVFVKNYQISSAQTIKEIKGKLKFARKVGETTFPTEDTAEVVFQLNLKDVL